MPNIELHDIDVQAFIEAIDKCKGNVYLETEEGDCLNLKSKLCQFTGIAKLIEGGMIAKATVRCENMEDDAMLFQYNLWRK